MRRVSLRVALALSLAGGVAGLGLWSPTAPARAEAKARVDPAAVERTRDNVRMIDDLYKGFVVNITATYVDGGNKTAAAKVTKKVFHHMNSKGWHSARLVDATGEPINKANAPKTAFEKEAIEQIKKGKPYYDQVGEKDGKPVLRAATIVPVVMKQCITCHPGKKEGDLLGAIVYEVPIK